MTALGFHAAGASVGLKLGLKVGLKLGCVKNTKALWPRHVLRSPRLSLCPILIMQSAGTWLDTSLLQP